MDDRTAWPQPNYMETIYRVERHLGVPLKWVLLVVGMYLAWSGGQPRTSALLLLSVALYGTSNVLFSYIFYADRPLALLTIRFVLALSLVADIFFGSVMIYLSGGVSSEFYLLYALFALKAALYYPLGRYLVLPLYLIGPLYAFVLYYSSSSFYFLTDAGFLVRYALLLGIVLGASYVGWLAESKQELLVQQGLALSLARQDLESKTELMKRTAQDLGNRVMELRSLQEGVKAINSALALQSVLRLIVANASQVLGGGARCSIALLDAKSQEVVTMAASGVEPDQVRGTRFALGEGVAGWVVANGKPVLIGDVRRDERFVKVGLEPIISLMSAPLVSDGVPIGALTATNPRANAFTPENLSRLEAFADQAAAAVKNSRLYEGLFEKSTELEAILRGIGDGVIVTDPEMNVLMINPVAARIFGLGRGAITVGNVSSLIPHEGLNALLRDALAHQDVAVIREIETADPQNSKHDMIYQGLATPIPAADGQMRGIVTVLRDITSQKELERMKSNFLSVVSHELRTPLHSIKGFVDIILMGKTGEVTDLQRDFLTTVKQQTGQLQTLIGDLLEFSRLESGQVRLRIAAASLTMIALRVTEKLEPLANDGQLRLANRVPDKLVVEGDEMRLEQVLTNLVDNAIKFTPVGGTVAIEGHDLGDEVKVVVRDTGIGIPEPEREKIFDRFYQVDSGSTRSYKGTGLGLTICKHIVEHHHGRIWVEANDEGQGSMFIFVLPKKHQEEAALALDFTTLPSERGQRSPEG
ncbi:MAG: GAF domain-containing protein [Chloroflexi bacterium]|nr:GAF domain-containing protein [Chloroflexota bacterium]